MASRAKKKKIYRTIKLLSGLTNGQWLSILSEAKKEGELEMLEHFCKTHGLGEQFDYYVKAFRHEIREVEHNA